MLQVQQSNPQSVSLITRKNGLVNECIKNMGMQKRRTANIHSSFPCLLFIPSSAIHLQFIQRSPPRTYNESAVDVVVEVVGGGR